MITKRSHFNLSANLFLHRWTIFGALCVFLFSTLFTSCFSDLKTSKKTTVTFNMSRQTVQKILGNIESLPAPAARSGDDPFDPDNPTSTTYIDVTLYAVEKQTKTAVVSSKSDLSMEFEEVPVGASVYAKAKIYRYTDSQKTIRDVVYNGESSRIVVRDGVNTLSLKLAGAVLTVTFNSNGGTSVSSKKVQTGSTVEKPKDPVKPAKKEKYSRYDNYAFEGWYTDPELTKGFDFSSPVTDDVTLYAKWLNDFVYVEGDVVSGYLADGRNITIGNLFVSDHEVTQAEYYAVTNNNPSQNNSYGDDLPVEQVSWFDAIKYCNLLSIREGLTPCYKVNNSTIPSEWGSLNSDTQVACNLNARGYRLPTEAEWEYIATKAERNKTLDSMAMYSSNSLGRTQKIKTTLADELYLCDLLGNVAEWCFDVYSTSITSTTGKTGPVVVSGADNQRVVRGGAYNSPASECSKDARSYSNPTIASNSIGFRVVRSAIDEFAVITNTVTFLSNGGSAVATQYIVEGETASQPADPTKTGYNFDGWLYNGSVFDFGTIIAQDIVLEAEWSLINYTINYVLGEGATNASTNPSTYTIETETFNLQDPTRDSYNFMGWYNEDVDPDLRITRIEKGSYGNITLTAHWTQCFVVTFNTNGGSSVSTQAVEDQSCATEPGAPTKPGYDFGGWYTDSTLNNGFSFTTPISDNINLYAKWNPRNDTNYYIKHYKQKTTGSEYDLVETETRQGTTDQPTTISSSDAKTYTGFNVSSTNTIQNVTITGNGEAVVNIYYDRLTFQVKYDDGVTTETISVPSAETYRYGATVNIDFTSIGTRPGYTFAGWNDGSTTYTSSGTTSFIMDLSAVTLTAVWTANTNTPYTVKYFFQNVDCDASATPTVSDYLSNTAYPATTSYGTTGTTTSVSAPSVSGFTVSTVNPIQNKTISGDGSTVVNVYYDRVKKTVTYTANQTGVSNPASQTYLYGQPITLDFSIATAAPGYDFNGWKDNNSGTVYTSESTLTMGTSNISLIGQWTVHNFSITYLPEGITVTGGDFTYNINNPGTCPTSVEPTTNGVFGGWYLEDDFSGEPITEVSMDTVGELKNVNVYAYFTKTVFVKDGGSSSTTGLNGLNPSNAVNSVSTAVSKIVDLNIGEFDWNIAIVGTVTGTQIIDNSSLTTAKANSVTLTGYGTNATLNANNPTSGSNRTTLSIKTTYPITITNLIITGGRGIDRSGNDKYYGGGLCVLMSGASVTLGDGVKIRGNCCDYGGGVYVCQNAKLYMIGTAEVGDSTKTAASSKPSYDSFPSEYGNDWTCANYATGINVSGGGIYNDGYVCLGYSYYYDSNDNIPARLDGGIYGNWGFEGGGISNSQNGTVVMKSGNINNNSSAGMNKGGGGIYNEGIVYLRGGSINSNIGDAGAGAVYNYEDGIFSMEGGEIKNNIGDKDFGVVMIYDGSFSMTGGTISGNQTLYDSSKSCGGVMCWNGSVTITGGTIKDNLDMNGSKCSGLYVSAQASEFILGGANYVGGNITYADIPYDASNNNCIYAGIPIEVYEPVDSSYPYAINRLGTITTSTVILTGLTSGSSSYSCFTLLNDGWTIDTTSGKAKTN